MKKCDQLAPSGCAPFSSLLAKAYFPINFFPRHGICIGLHFARVQPVDKTVGSSPYSTMVVSVPHKTRNHVRSLSLVVSNKISTPVTLDPELL
jgi:hypothetical protein